MLDYLLAFISILLILIIWIIVQHLSRRFARQHPQFGPVEEDGAGCARHCLYKSDRCQQQSKLTISGD